MRPLPTILSVIATIIVAFGIFQVSYRYFQSQELSKAEGRLSLYRSTVFAELERFSHLTYVLARDPYVIETSKRGDTSALNHRLEGFARQAGLDAIYLMDPDGITVSASNARLESSFVGQDYSFRPYFQTALAGGLGRFYGIGATTGLPGYFIADPVRDAEGSTRGVIAIKIDLSKLEDSWRNAGEQVFLANGDGVVLLSSDKNWRYRVLRPVTPEQRTLIESSRQFPGQPLEPLDWSSTSAQKARIAGSEWLHLTADDLPHNWELHYFASDERAVVLGWLVSAAFILMAGLMLILFQVQRARRMGVALKRSEEEEAQLRDSNARLAVEIEDRRAAERRLKRTQGELEQASRLAALGQLAASVTHELGQPIAAMRNHLAAAEIGGNSDPAMPTKIGALVDRMDGITRQLKFFARTEQDAFGEVELCEAMDASLSLLAPNIEKFGVVVERTYPQSPVNIRGNRLRIEQVMTNIVRNAIDAVEDCATPVLWVSVGASGSGAWFEVRDNGHGLGAATLAELREPFVTTRESGQGMGLGLAISSTIVNDHGGRMSAQNAKDGGTVFRVDFPTQPREGDAP